MNTDLRIGFQNEWVDFFKRHPSWPEKYTFMINTLDKIFQRQPKLNNEADKVIFFIGRLCVEDFKEIFLLCGNGYGFGALKILRGLYERTVTSGYIAKNPDQAKTFLEYHHIHKWKMLKHCEKLLKSIDHKELEEAKRCYEEHKGKFQRCTCKKCEKYETQPSWSKLDVLSMAKKVGIEELYYMAFYEPTLQTHATAASILCRLKEDGSGSIIFDGQSQRDCSDRALVAAHQVMLHVLKIQNEYFNLSLDEEFTQLKNDFKKIWGENKP